VSESAKGAPEQAVEILQAAAIETIRAMRSFLDIAESLVREPETAAVVGKAFAEAAAAAMRPRSSSDDERARGGEDEDEDDDEGDQPSGRLRRIDLSD
jgi:hypothetical protein